MTTCSDSFWFWFMRPAAEFLGSIALGAFIIICLGSAFIVYVYMENRNKKK